jgi:hypothetical protein
MKIRPVGPQLLKRTDGREKAVVALRNFVNAPKNVMLLRQAVKLQVGTQKFIFVSHLPTKSDEHTELKYCRTVFETSVLQG